MHDAFLDERWPAILAKSGPNGALRSALTHWAEADPTPLVLLLDEIDTLIGDTLLSVLRQLRAGYDRRLAYVRDIGLIASTLRCASPIPSTPKSCHANESAVGADIHVWGM